MKNTRISSPKCKPVMLCFPVIAHIPTRLFVCLLVVHSMTEKCNSASDELGRLGMVLVAHVTRLIELSLDYWNVPSDDYNKDKRMGCMFNLLVRPVCGGWVCGCGCGWV